MGATDKAKAKERIKFMEQKLFDDMQEVIFDLACREHYYTLKPGEVNYRLSQVLKENNCERDLLEVVQEWSTDSGDPVYPYAEELVQYMDICLFSTNKYAIHRDILMGMFKYNTGTNEIEYMYLDVVHQYLTTYDCINDPDGIAHEVYECYEVLKSLADVRDYHYDKDKNIVGFTIRWDGRVYDFIQEPGTKTLCIYIPVKDIFESLDYDEIVNDRDDLKDALIDVLKKGHLDEEENQDKLAYVLDRYLGIKPHEWL